MIVGLGIDLCPVARMAAVLERQGRLFVDRVFTAGEQARAGDSRVAAERYAARFAAKEATIKALGAPRGLSWREMEVVSAPDGRPSLELHGIAEQRAGELGVARCHLSLTHAGGVAAAVVVLEREDP